MASVEKRIAAAFGLDDKGWARHANPWSGWSRILTGMSLIIVAVWSRVWIGWWSLVPIVLVMLWIWANPRLFPPPADDHAWISRGVFGEKLWAERVPDAVARYPAWRAKATNGVAFVGALVLVYGLIRLDAAATIIGASLGYIGKMVFIGDMVRLYDEVKAAAPHLGYAS